MPLIPILFVDDDENILSAIRRGLRNKRRQWEMAFVTSADEAIERLQTESYPVVITDLSMPGRSGIDLIHHINRHAPQVRCIVLSGTADLQTAAHIINDVQVFRFYTKPFELDDLVRGIEDAIVRADAIKARKETGEDHLAGNMILDHISTAIIVVSGKGRVVFLNQAAAEFIGDGLSIGHDNVLRAGNANDTNQLLNFCDILSKLNGSDEVDDPGVFALSLKRPEGNSELNLVLSIMPNDPESDHETGGGEGRNVVIVVSDTELQTVAPRAVIARLLDLTRTESELAQRLSAGQRLQDIAESMGVTVSTARTYLKRILQKTCTNRQVDLVRLILSIPNV